jgi:sec-independent protein translocase protein TatA
VSLDTLHFMFALVGPLGPLELGIIALIVLVIFGPKRLPDLGRSLGTGMREFKDSITGKSGGDDDDEDAPPADRAELGPSTPAAPTGERDEAVTRRGTS